MKYRMELLAAVALVCVLGIAVAMQRPQDTREAAAVGGNAFAVRDARVFDGERDLGVSTVVVRDGVIEAVGAGLEIPAGVPVVEGRGRTLLPGLIDAHVHAWGDAQRDMARFGVTTAVDLHGMGGRAAQLKAQREAVDDVGQADLWAAGYAVTAPGGHGTQYGFAVPTVDAGTDIDAFIGARLDEGADLIKLIIEDLSAYGGGHRLPTLSRQQVAQVIAATHARGRLAVAHVATLEDARSVIEADADGLVHVFSDRPADDAFVAAVRERGAFIVPTLSVIASMAGSGEGGALAADAAIAPWLSDEQGATLGTDFGARNPDRLQRAIDSVRRLHAAGVDIVAGSDAPNPGTAHGASLHHELALLVRAGLSPQQALASATSVPAARFGLDGRGRIAAGMRADLVLVEGDPLSEIADTRRIDSVWKNGYPVQRDPARQPAAAEIAATATLVSDFDGDALAASFGSWQATTDQMAGGTSVVEHALVAGGADGSRGALRVAGEIKAGFAFPWSGMMFFPAAQQMQAVELSARRELVFRVRGDGRDYSVMLFSGASAQGMPSMQPFVAGPAWAEVRIPLSSFQGGDPAQVRAIAFTAGQPRGRFEFFIDHVELR